MALFVLAFFCLLGILTASGRLPLVVLCLYLAASVVTFAIYALDKSASIHSRRRIPERTLHLLSAVGGWPGAAAAQQTLRHKTQKQEFRRTFWLTVLANCAALSWWLMASGGPAG